ncbi:unnamed protein product [Lathyrus oleraceus]
MSSRVHKNLIAMLEAEEAEAAKSNNHGTADAFNNSGSNAGDRKKWHNHGNRTVNNDAYFTESHFDRSTMNDKNLGKKYS